MNTNSDFVAWVEEELKIRDWKPSDLAKQAGIDTGLLSRIMNRERQPGVEYCLAIAKAFRVHPAKAFMARGWLPREPIDSTDEGRLLTLVRWLPDGDRRILLRLAQALSLSEQADQGISSGEEHVESKGQMHSSLELGVRVAEARTAMEKLPTRTEQMAFLRGLAMGDREVFNTLDELMRGKPRNGDAASRSDADREAG
jgi:transcriptional regulator with XRE-family HTH domain